VLCYANAHELVRRMQAGELSAQEITRAVLERIDEVEGTVGAYVNLCPERALETAGAVDDARARGTDLPPLAGVPIAVKDVICMQGMPTTCSSRILENFRPPYDATVARRVIDGRMPVLGKANMDEFAMGSSTENSAFHITRNPWDTERIPGGSSGGSAAAVAAGEAILALGSDTGGSIRQPACLCGVVGLKPTYGRVSRYGLVAFASSLDQIGPITRSVRDCALLLGAISGHDPLDSTSLDEPVPDYAASLERPVSGMRIGVPAEYFTEGIDGDVRESVEAAIDQLVSLGAKRVDISLPHTKYAVATYYIVATAEASSNLARYDGVHYGYRSKSADQASDASAIIALYENTRAEGFGDEVKRRIMLGTYALSAGYYDAYYLRALRVRTLLRRDFDAAFEKVDCVACPVSPTPAFRIGEKMDDPLSMYLSDIYTISANLAGIPGISVPCGLTSQGLPVGLQLLGSPLGEEALLRLAYAFEQSTEHHTVRPELAGKGAA